MRAEIASLLWSVTQFYIINRPTLEKHLRESIKVIINSLLFSTKYIKLNNSLKYITIFKVIIISLF